MEDKTTKNISITQSNNNVKLAPLFRTVSVPDEQVPGFNHLVNRPQSWIPQPRSKRPTRGILILFYVNKICLNYKCSFKSNK